MAITKVINSESQAYRPVLTDTLVLDAVPTVNSFNSVTSDAVARAVAGASGEVPQVTENDNGKVLKAIYDAGGPAVEWGEATVDQNYDATSTNAQSGTAVAQAIAAIPSATYTAGDGIDITANEVSVKAGNGLSIGNASGQGQIQLSSSRVSNGESYSYVNDICTLTSDLLDIICNGQGGLSVTLSRPVSFNRQVFVQPAICGFSSSSGGATNAQGVFGEAIYIDRTLPAGTTLTFDSSAFTNIEWIDLSYLQTLSDSELADYHLAVIEANGSYGAGSFYDTNPTATSIDTATYTGTITIPDALNVSNPLPTSAVGDAGKVLTVSAAGAAEWATPSGGSSSFTLTKVGTVTDYLPTTGYGMSLSFTTVSGQSNFIDPTKLYILKVKVSCVDSGLLSFGSAPYLALTSYNTEYNAVNRTHLSYAFPQILSGSMSSSASTNTPVYFFDEVANNLHIAPTGGQENDLKIEVGDVLSESANTHRITVDLYMVN